MSTQFCHNCGRNIGAVNFCPGCGTEQQIPAENPAAPVVAAALPSPTSHANPNGEPSQPSINAHEKTGPLGTKRRKFGAVALAVTAVLGIGIGATIVRGHFTDDEPVTIARHGSAAGQESPEATTAPTTQSVAPSGPGSNYEQGSVEYYQVRVKDYPTASDAVKRFAQLMEQFQFSGRFDINTGDETVDSVHADDNVLAAIFGEDFEDNNPVMVDVERQMRSKLSQAKYLVDSYTSDRNPFIYHFTYSPLTGTINQLGEVSTIEVEMRAFSNINVWLSASFDAQKRQQISLQKILNNQGEEIWQFVRVINLE